MNALHMEGKILFDLLLPEYSKKLPRVLDKVAHEGHTISFCILSACSKTDVLRTTTAVIADALQ